MRTPNLGTALALATVIAAPLASQDLPSPARLLRDVNSATSAVEIPSGFVRVGPWSYFVVDDGATSRLFRTLGTASSTQLFLDLDPSAPQDISRLTDVNGRLFFIGGGRGAFPSLFVSDGTVAGTRSVPLPSGFRFSGGFTAGVNDRLVFFGDTTGGRQPEPWASDGTAAGTERLVAAGSGPFGSPGLPSFQPVIRGAGGAPDRLWFHSFVFSSPSGTGSQYWSTDGTPKGTRVVATFGDLVVPGSPVELSSGRLALSQLRVGSGPELVVIEEGQAPTVLNSFVGQTASAPSFLFDGRAFVTADGADALFATDGTTGGTMPIALSGGSKVGLSSILSSDGNELWLAYFDIARGWRLARLDRGSSTAVDVAALAGEPLSPTGGGPLGAVRVGNRLIIPAFDTQGRKLLGVDVQGGAVGASVELWRGSRIVQVARQFGTVLFAADETTSGAVYATDGTQPGTSLLLRPSGATRSLSSNPSSFTPFGDRLVFLGRNGFGAASPWITDGTTAGTELLADSTVTGARLEVGQVLVVGDELWTFRYDPSRFGSLLIDAHDGRPGVRRSVASVPNLNPFQPVEKPVAVGQYVVFSADIDLEPGIWSVSTDGTVQRLLSTSAPIEESIALGEEALLLMPTGRNRTREAWLTDGTPANTRQIGQVGIGFMPLSAVRYDDAVWISSFSQRYRIGDGSISFEGTEAARTSLFVVGDKLFAMADGRLTVSDGPVANDVVLATGGTFDREGRLAAVALGESLLFARNDRPWISDGTVAGTVQLADVALGDSEFWVASNSRAVFAATNPSTQERALYVTDGTQAGTQWLEDLPVAETSPFLGEIGIAHGGNVFLSVMDPILGVEPHVVDPRFSTEMRGMPCSGAGFSTATLRTVGADPRLGETLQIIASSAGASVGWLGFGPPASRPVVIAGTSCSTQLDLFGATFTQGLPVGSAGQLQVALSIPQEPALLGVRLAIQSVMATGRGPLAGDLSPTVVLTVGR